MLDALPKSDSDNGPGDFKVTANGTVSSAGIMSASSIQRCFGGSCDSVCQGQDCGIIYGKTTVSGYLLDVFCYERAKRGGKALDGADIIKRPWEHTIHCLRDLPQCRAGGYYVAYNKGNATGRQGRDYDIKYKLDNASNAKVLEMLDALPKSDSDNGPGNFKITAIGTVSSAGIMSLSNIQRCFGGSCDSSCQGQDCGITFSSGDADTSGAGDQMTGAGDEGSETTSVAAGGGTVASGGAGSETTSVVAGGGTVGLLSDGSFCTGASGVVLLVAAVVSAAARWG